MIIEILPRRVEPNPFNRVKTNGSTVPLQQTKIPVASGEVPTTPPSGRSRPIFESGRPRPAGGLYSGVDQ